MEKGDAIPAQLCEALISINTKLDMPEAAVGILTEARQKYNVELEVRIHIVLEFSLMTLQQETWYEKLGRWEQAREVYEKKLATDSCNMEYIMGRIRCLHALAEWEKLNKISEM